MTQILGFNPADPIFQHEIASILDKAPIKNLTYEEVETTLRLIEIQEALQNSFGEVIVNKNDKRLELCDDNDRFLALLADCDARDVLLFTGHCISLFGGKIYKWRKIAHNCPIITVASTISEFGSGYYGRGWEIAPHIKRLIKWIKDNIKD